MKPLHLKNWLTNLVKDEEKFFIKISLPEVLKDLSFLNNIVDFKIIDAWNDIFKEYFNESQDESEKSVVNAFFYFKSVNLTIGSELNWEVIISFNEISDNQKHLIQKDDVLNIVIEVLNHWGEECLSEKKLITKKIGSGRIFTDDFMMKKDMTHKAPSTKHQIKKF